MQSPNPLVCTSKNLQFSSISSSKIEEINIFRNQHFSQSIAAIFVQETWCNKHYKWRFLRAHAHSYMKFPA
jgi:hypothetical protein